MYSKRAEQAARAFYAELRPGAAWDYNNHPVKELVLAAFHLYELAWNPKEYDIRQWRWPLATLQEGGEFSGNEAWAVLLHRAVDLARTPATV